MNGRTLRTTAGLTRAVAAAAVGALAVGLIPGVIRTSPQAQTSTAGTTSTSTSSNSNNTNGNQDADADELGVRNAADR